MSSFTEKELAYLLGERRLARLATVGADGMPSIAASAPSSARFQSDGVADSSLSTSSIRPIA